MRFLSLLASSALASAAVGLSRNPQHVNKKHLLDKTRRQAPSYSAPSSSSANSTNGTIIPQNVNTTKFALDGSAIPNVTFDVGEGYAGLLPISEQANSSELYFVFFPSENELAGDEILIWRTSHLCVTLKQG